MKGAATLSDREKQVVKMIAEGKTKKEIANELRLSVRTIENHTRTSFKKNRMQKID